MPSSSSSTFWRIASILVIVAALALAFWIVTRTPGDGDADRAARVDADETLQLVTWNLYNFGRSKDAGEVAFMADLLRDADVVAIQEVSTGPAGPDAVARLDALLDQTGTAWDYVVSEPTSGDGSERYAYLWKTGRVRLVGAAWLEPSLERPIDREPYMARFAHAGTGKQVLMASLHAVPRGKDPAKEIVLLDRLHDAYPDDHLLVMGDFNLDEDDPAFDPLEQAGYTPVLDDQKTSLRMKPKDGDHLANEYDNIYYETAQLRALDTGVIDFTGSFATLKEARAISDHLPVYMRIGWR